MNLKINPSGSIELESFVHNLEDIQIIDVRSKVEWQEGHMPKAIHIPLDEIDDRLDEIDPNKPVAFICAKGMRAAIAWKYFKYKNPDNILSGYVVATIDYKKNKEPVFHMLDDGWHQDIATHIENM